MMHTPRLTLRDFIRRHRRELDAIIRAHLQNIGRLSDQERANLVRQDEGLSWWAQKEGVSL